MCGAISVARVSGRMRVFSVFYVNSATQTSFHHLLEFLGGLPNLAYGIEGGVWGE